MTDRTLLIQAKKIGTTNISIYDHNSQLIKVVDVEVTLDTGDLQSKIRGVTGSRGIHVSTDNGQVVLSGTAIDAADADQAMTLAKSWSQNGNVINAMRIASPQEVMLKVRFLEVDRNAGRELGINTYATNGSGTRGVNTGLGGLTSSSPQTCAPSGNCPPIGNSIFQAAGTLVGASVGQPFGTILAQIVNNGVKIDTLITALETKGMLQRLAEPNLVALSGQTASFQAGGPNSGSDRGDIGHRCCHSDHRVQRLWRAPAVPPYGPQPGSYQSIDQSRGQSARFLECGDNLRHHDPGAHAADCDDDGRAQGWTKLRDCRPLQTDNNRNISQLPWVGSLPVLGALFRSTAYQKDESDLVIIVTPHLVAPATPGTHLATPFDTTVPPNDVDFFALGEMERRKQFSDYVSHGGEVKGPVW